MKSIVLFALLYLAVCQIPQAPNPLRQKPDLTTQPVRTTEPGEAVPVNGDFEELEGDFNFLPERSEQNSGSESDSDSESSSKDSKRSRPRRSHRSEEGHRSRSSHKEQKQSNRGGWEQERGSQKHHERPNKSNIDFTDSEWQLIESELTLLLQAAKNRDIEALSPREWAKILWKAQNSQTDIVQNNQP